MVERTEKGVWQSQTEAVAFVGTLAMALQMLGYISLTPEQVSILGSALFVMVMLTRKWSDGAKLVFQKSKVLQDVKAGRMPTAGDLQSDAQCGLIAMEAVNKALSEAGYTPQQLEKFLAALDKNQP